MAIKPKHKHSKRQKFWQSKKFLPALMGLFIISIMIFSVLGLWTGEQEETYTYKGIKFARTDYGWIGYKDKTQVVISSNPADLEEITLGYIPVYTMNSLSKIYVSMDYTSSMARAIQDFEQNIKLTTQTVPACITDNERCANLPLKDCADATEDIGVIVFKQSEETEVSLINNCLTIQGQDLTNLVDKLILTQL